MTRLNLLNFVTKTKKLQSILQYNFLLSMYSTVHNTVPIVHLVIILFILFIFALLFILCLIALPAYSSVISY